MLNKDYIVPALGGRLGNNMFMVAHAYVQGLKYNKQMVIAKNQLVYEGNDYSQNVFSKFEFITSCTCVHFRVEFKYAIVLLIIIP